MSRFEQNIKILLDNPNHMIDALELSQICYKYVVHDDKSEFFQDMQGHVYELKNQFEIQGKTDKLQKELYFILGIDGIDEIKKLVEGTNASSVFIVYEPYGEFLEYALTYKDMSIFNDKRIILIVKPLEIFKMHIHEFISQNHSLISLYGCLRFYATYFYRHYRLDVYKEFVKAISDEIQILLRINGNSLEDSLIGFRQNAKNGKYLFKSKDVSKLSTFFAGKPAFIVAAGPSLNKNIQALKRAKGHGLIFAVDTILARLLAEGIVPDFVCTIERDEIVYDSFYKQQNIPPEVTLLAPTVLASEIFDEFPGNFVIPLRILREYWWWNKIYDLPEASYVEQGQSCAHLAFGIAAKMKCAPIVFVGQDLSYGENDQETHARGTIYDDAPGEATARRLTTAGYYGGNVETNQVWYDFRLWFENQIKGKELFAINSTEGGARIAGAEAVPLQTVIDKYCQAKINVQELLNQCPYYSLDKNMLRLRLSNEVKELEREKNELTKHCQRLDEISLEENATSKQLLDALKTMKTSGDLLQSIIDEQFLLGHFMQPEMAIMMIAVSRIRQELTYKSVSANLQIQLRFFCVAVVMLEAALNIIEEHCKWINE